MVRYKLNSHLAYYYHFDQRILQYISTLNHSSWSPIELGPVFPPNIGDVAVRSKEYWRLVDDMHAKYSERLLDMFG